MNQLSKSYFNTLVQCGVNKLTILLTVDFRSTSYPTFMKFFDESRQIPILGSGKHRIPGCIG